MISKEEVLKEILENKLVAVVRGKDKEEALNIIEACVEGGIKLIEVTYTNKDASEIIKHLCENNKKALVGAGSVISLDRAKAALESGAKFIVGPNYDEAINEFCMINNILYIPGSLTPTEIMRAVNSGVDIIKLFPGDLVGAKYVKAIKAPMPEVRMMVTGGVNLDNIEEWFKAGVQSVGLGSVLTEGTDNNYEKIKAKAASFLAKVKGE